MSGGVPCEPVERATMHWNDSWRRTTPTSGSCSRSATTSPAPSRPWSQRYQDRLVGILFHLVGNIEEAEDLSQDVFLRIYKPARATGPGPSSRPGCSRSPTTWRSTTCGEGPPPVRAHGRRGHRLAAHLADRPRARRRGRARRPPDAQSRALGDRPRRPGASRARTRRWPSCSTSSRT